MCDIYDSELLRFYDNILLKNLAYCSVCLREEKERRLVPPQAIKKLSDVLNLPSEHREFYPVCYMCEAYAASVIRFHAMVMASLKMGDLFQNMLQRKRFENQVRDCLMKHRGDKIAQNATYKQALECEMQLKKVRSRCRLQQTEVLLIDSDGVNFQVNDTDGITNDDPSVLTLQNTAPGPGMETVVILDDEDEPKMINRRILPATKVTSEQNSKPTPKLVPIEKLLETSNSNQNIASLLPNQMQVLQPDKDAASSFMLHPIVIENDGSFNVPTLSAKLLNGRLVYQERNNPLLLANASNPTILVGSQDKSTILIGNQDEASILVGKPDTALSGNSNNPTILVGNGETVGNHVNNESANVSSIVIKEGSVTCLSDVESELDRILKETADALTNSSKRSFDGSNGRNKKRAIDALKQISEKEKESKIDWEDKIPMDVISFVDAVDPHADPKLRSECSVPLMIPTPKQFITPDGPPRRAPVENESPMGIISEVRSVTASSISTQTQFEADNIIDLC